MNWEDMGKGFNDQNWDEKSESTDTIQLCEEIIELLENSAKENAPKRGKKGNKSRIPRERKKLHNRIKMLKRDKHKAYSKEKKRSLEKKILETEQKIIESKRNERSENEKHCIDCMKDNPRVFYSFINKQRNRRIEIGPFKKDKEFIYDGKEICECLKTEYTSQQT
ncbi:MAG: hypothetical protein GY679_04215, partial [Mycoplasma sp.]|nr:hypothetical protein [Mycoplasma sp.]